MVNYYIINELNVCVCTYILRKKKYIIFCFLNVTKDAGDLCLVTKQSKQENYSK